MSNVEPVATPAGFFIGASYYPEHWPEAAWQEHFRIMQDLGFNIVRLLEFAWSRLEPAEGVFDFDWVDRALDLCLRHGLKVMLGTPSAAPPVWLTHRYPDVLPVSADGIQRQAGGRHHYCVNNPHFRAATARVVERLGQHVRGRDTVVAWQVDNELGTYGSTFCYCQSCVSAFRDWLRDRYGDIDTLNQRWGTVFWSQEVTDWDQVDIPRPAMSSQVGSNKSAVLDYWRFASHSMVEFVAEQVGLIHAARAGVPVTTNWTGIGAAPFDFAEMAQRLDFTSWDNYTHDYRDAAFKHDFVRGMKDGKQPFWNPEQVCAPPDNQQFTRLLADGAVTNATIHNIACGSDATIYFRLEQLHFGAENAYSGILDRRGGTDTRIYRELKASVPRLRQIGERVSGSQVNAQAAIVFDAESNATVSSPLPHKIKKRSEFVRHTDHFVLPYYRALSALGIEVDVVPPGQDISGYQVVVLAGLYLTTPELVKQLRAYVERGGCLVATPFTAIADQNANLIADDIPAGLTDVFGARVTEHDCLDAGETAALQSCDAGSAELNHTGSVWCDVIQCGTARPLFTYRDRNYSSPVAITLNVHGRGLAVYVGTVPADATCRDLFRSLLRDRGITLTDHLPDGVQIRRRYTGSQEFLFALNFTGHEQKISLDDRYTDVVTGANRSGPITIAVNDGVVLRRDRAWRMEE